MLWERDRLPLNEKKSTKSQIRLMSWYWTQKSTWRKDLIAYNSHLRTRIMFPFDYHLEKAGGRFIWNWMFKAKRVEEFRTRASWTRGVGGLENWTIFMDAICELPQSILARKVSHVHCYKNQNLIRWIKHTLRG